VINSRRVLRSLLWPRAMPSSATRLSLYPNCGPAQPGLRKSAQLASYRAIELAAARHRIVPPLLADRPALSAPSGPGRDRLSGAGSSARAFGRDASHAQRSRGSSTRATVSTPWNVRTKAFAGQLGEVGAPEQRCPANCYHLAAAATEARDGGDHCRRPCTRLGPMRPLSIPPTNVRSNVSTSLYSPVRT